MVLGRRYAYWRCHPEYFQIERLKVVTSQCYVCIIGTYILFLSVLPASWFVGFVMVTAMAVSTCLFSMAVLRQLYKQR